MKVLSGFLHVLKADGFAFFIVPDMGALMRGLVAHNWDIDDDLYIAENGAAITACDVIYGWGREIESSGNDFFAHKTGFTEKSLRGFLAQAGFPAVYSGPRGWLELVAFAFKHPPSAQVQDEVLAALKKLAA